MAYASTSDARDAMLSLFKTAWGGQSPVPPLAYDDNPFDTPPLNVAWARVWVQHNKGSQATLGATGSRRFRKYGIITVQVFTPAGGGLTANDTMVKIAIDAFEGKTTKPDGVLFTNVRLQEIGTNGSYFQTNVIAQFQYDTIK